MAFLGSKSLKNLLTDEEGKSKGVITPFDKGKIKNGAYELSLGEQVFQTDSKAKKIKQLKSGDKIKIKPGQFALLLTREVIEMPGNKIAFISIKAGIKFKGLVNVSGFHVDPKWKGKLLFSVYNAGPATIVLSSGTSYFPIWFAELSETQKYLGEHGDQDGIPDKPIESLSQGRMVSPNVLSQRIEKLKNLKNTTILFLSIILTIVSGLALRLWFAQNEISKAIDYGYEKRSGELRVDSIKNEYDNNLKILRTELDSLIDVLDQKSQSGGAEKEIKKSQNG